MIGEPRPILWARAVNAADQHVVFLPGGARGFVVSVGWRKLRAIRKYFRRYLRHRIQKRLARLKCK